MRQIVMINSILEINESKAIYRWINDIFSRDKIKSYKAVKQTPEMIKKIPVKLVLSERFTDIIFGGLTRGY